MMDLERWNLLTPGDNVTRVGSSQRERVQTVIYDKGTGNVTSIAINDGTMEGITLFRGGHHMRPRQGDRVVNTRGALIGHIRDRAYWIGKSNVGPGYSAMFTVAVGRQQYRIMEWDRSWAAWVAYGRRKS